MKKECKKEEINNFSDIIKRLEKEMKEKNTFIQDIGLLRTINK